MVTVKLAEVVPSAGTVLGVMLTDERVADGVAAAGTEKVTDDVWVSVTVSWVSTAVKTEVSATLSVTVKTATPALFVTTAVFGSTEALPVPESVTLRPATGWRPAVSSVTVTVVPPLGPVSTAVEAAATVEAEGETVRVPKVTVAWVLRVTPPAMAV
jgi:hypothetical protein